MFLIVLMSSVIAGTTANISIYMATYFWALTPASLRWFALASIGAALAFPLVTAVQRRWDKKNIYLFCSIISLADGMLLVTLRFLRVLPNNGSPWLLTILVVDVAFVAGVSVIQGIIGSSVVADILDLHELQTGLRQEAMFNAALSFSGKAVSGVGIVLGGLILSFIALPPHVAPADVAPAVITRLGIVVGLVLPFLYVFPIYLTGRYRISRQVHAEIRSKLAQRNLTGAVVETATIADKLPI